MTTASPKRGKAEEGANKGEALLTAVERIVDWPEKIRTRTEQFVSTTSRSLPDDATDEQVREAVEQRIISDYSNRTALAGGAAALPGLIPGIGSLTALLGGGLVDMTFCLKFEVEMVLALAAARGYAIEDPRERQLAYLLAAAHTYEASSGKNILADLIKTEADAIWNYTPRQLGKILAALFAKVALLFLGKSLGRAIPLVGILVSTAANKTLTLRVGRSVVKALDARGVAPQPRARPKAAKPARAAKPAKAAKAKPARKPKPATRKAAGPRA